MRKRTESGRKRKKEKDGGMNRREREKKVSSLSSVAGVSFRKTCSDNAHGGEGPGRGANQDKIGRASCRERV